MKHASLCLCVFGTLVGLLFGEARGQTPMGTAFAYQGRLTDGGSPASGDYDFEFTLYDALADPSSLVAGPIHVEDHPVTTGLFTVPLDFGTGIFTGDARWLEIGVRPGDSTSSYTTLSPRQQLTPTPYALALPGLWTQQNATCPNLLGGFPANTVTASAYGATISGGGTSDNLNRVTDHYGSVGGGSGNRAGNDDVDPDNALHATVGGGYQNVAADHNATVSGGSSNVASGTSATIGGGISNETNTGVGTVAGGQDNTAGYYASVGGGAVNTATGMWATVPGGLQNTADGHYALAAGRRAQANHQGTFLWADSTDADFSSTAPNQFLIRAAGHVGIGTDSPSSPLTVNGTIESTTNGFKFPDGTTQTTAATSGMGGSGTTDHIAKFTGADTLGDSVIQEYNGRVGIGIATPEQQFQVVVGSGGGKSEPTWHAVYGETDAANTHGVHGKATGAAGVGVYGEATGLNSKAGHFEGDLTANGMIESATSGFKFPDASVQTTAAASVPTGFFILGSTPTPPAGYSLVGPLLTADGWEFRSPMPAARRSAAIAVVNSRIYVIGGDEWLGPPYLDVVEEYDPATDTWSTRAPMPTPRYGAAAAAVNGKIYVVGGRHDDGSWLATNEEYDPDTDTWTTKADMPTGRAFLGAASVNGKLYAIGGLDEWDELAANEEYDPATNAWTPKTDMPTPRAHLAVGVIDGRIYAIGGENRVHNQQYNPSTDAWTNKASLPAQRMQHGVAVVQGKAHAIGGSGGLTANDVYDPASDTWVSKTPMAVGRYQLVVAAVEDKIYAIGGFGPSGALATNEQYTPSEKHYIHRKD